VYELVWDEEAKAELATVSAFRRKIVVDAIERQLRHQPDVETRHRKPLREHLRDLPVATWELRIHGDTRVLYCVVDRRTVSVLRVILKGSATLADAARRDREP
jgi:mRNA-degrading endonuclease RelE of RelBE toxin-antitoxin system